MNECALIDRNSCDNENQYTAINAPLKTGLNFPM